MATTQLQLRKGNVTQHNVFTGANAEVTVVTDESGNALSLRLHDGTTVGGIPVAGDGQVTTAASFGALIGAELSPYTVAVTQAYFAGGNGKGAGVYIKTSATGTPGDTNYGSYFYDADGFKWSLQHNGTVSIDQFGFVADFVLTSDSGATSTGTGTDNSPKLQAMFDDAAIKKITGNTGQYWFGIVAVNEQKINCSRPIEIDWAGAELFCAHSDPNAGSISSMLIRFLNTDLVSMYSFEFTQINFDALLAGGPGGRGVHGFGLVQNGGVGVLSRGVSFGNYEIHKGQSVFLCASDTKAVDRLENINLFGRVVGNSVYYGLNLFYSGHGFKGRMKIHEYIRAWIFNDVVDVDFDLIQEGNLAIPTSSAGLTNNNGDSAFKTERIKVKAVYDQIGGPLRISAPDAVGAAGNVSNCEFDIFVKDVTNIDYVNGNIMILGAYDSGGTYLTTGTMTAKDNSVKLRVGQALDQMNNLFLAQTRTPNSERNLIDAQRFDVTSFQNELIHYRSPFGATIGHRGDITTKVIELSLKKVLNKTIGPDPFYVTADVILTKSGTTDHYVQRWVLYGSVNSDGTETIRTATKVYEAGSGTYNPVLRFTTSPTGSPFVTIDSLAGGDADGRLSILIRPAAASVSLL